MIEQNNNLQINKSYIFKLSEKLVQKPTLKTIFV